MEIPISGKTVFVLRRGPGFFLYPAVNATQIVLVRPNELHMDLLYCKYFEENWSCHESAVYYELLDPDDVMTWNCAL